MWCHETGENRHKQSMQISVVCVLSHAVDSINIDSIEKCSVTAERGNGRGDHGLGKMPWHQPEHIYMYM